MTETIKVAAAQLSPFFLDKEKTVKKACSAILEAGKQGAKLIVFPEAFLSGYPDWVWLIPNSKGADLSELYIKLVENAVNVPDQATDLLCKAAKKAGITVVMGILYADIDLQQIFAAKRMFDVAGHYARPDVFNFSTNK